MDVGQEFKQTNSLDNVNVSQQWYEEDDVDGEKARRRPDQSQKLTPTVPFICRIFHYPIGGGGSRSCQEVKSVAC